LYLTVCVKADPVHRAVTESVNWLQCNKDKTLLNLVLSHKLDDWKDFNLV